MAARADPPGQPGTGSTLLVGRDHEQQQLRAHLTAALAGRGSLVLVGGESGIGKTTLVASLVREALAHDVLVLTGHCYDLSVTPSYGPWLEVAAAARHHADDPPFPAFMRDVAAAQRLGGRDELFRQVRQAFAGLASRRALVVVLEDLHWSDSDSLDLLRDVSRHADESRLLIATYRDDELNRQHPLTELLPALVRESAANRVRLRRLDAAATRALVERGYGLAGAEQARLVAHLQAHAEGNPFYTWELLRELEHEALLRSADGVWSLGDLRAARLPPLVRQVIERRLARLGERAWSLLRVAAAIGQQVPADLWLHVSEATREELDAAVVLATEAHLLEAAEATPGSAYLRFSHALVRETCYEGLAPLLRADLHRRIAEALARASRPEPGAIAHHFRRAGDPRAVDWLIRAALRAEQMNAWHAVAEHLLAAAALLEGTSGDDQRRGWLLYLAAERPAVATTHTTQRILALVEEAARLARNTSDRLLLLAAQRCRALFLCIDGDTQAGLSDYHAATRLWERLTLAERRRFSEAINGSFAWLESGAPIPGRTGEHELPAVVDTLDAAAFHGPFVNPLVRYGYLAEALAIGEEILSQLPADPATFVWDAIATARTSDWMDALLGLGQAYALLGRLGEARRAFAWARTAYQAAGRSMFEAGTLVREIELVLVPYLIDDARERARLAGEVMSTWDRARPSLERDEPARAPLLQLLFLEGEWDATEQVAVAMRASERRAWQPIAACLLAELAHRRGAREPALSYIREFLPEGPESVPGRAPPYYAAALQRVGAVLALDEGDMDVARAWLLAHDDWLAWSGMLLGQAEGQVLWARFHHTAGEPAAARQAAQRALELAGDPRQPLVLLQARRLLGRLETEAGRRAAAERHLRESLALADACAAPFERALTLLDLAELRVATGAAAEARVALDEARAICAPLGAAPALAQADAIEARLSERAASAVPANPAGLSQREVEILRLIAAGRSNRQIAADLAISPRTTERHITNIYTKVNAATRAEAIAFAHRHHLI